MAITSYTGVLHTNSIDYFDTFTGLEENNIEKESQIIALQNKEQSFYQSMFGVGTIEEFIAKLKGIFSDIEQDTKTFRFFENSNIRPWLRGLNLTSAAEIQSKPLTINITYKGESGEIDFSEIFQGVGDGLELSSSKDSLKLTFGPNLEEIKKAFNKHFKYKKVGLGDKDWVQTGTLFSSDSKDASSLKENLASGKALRSYLIQNFTNTFQKIDWSKISIRVSNASALTTILTDETKINNPLFNENNKDLVNDAQEGKQSAINKIKKIREELYQKIWSASDMGRASTEMQIAFKRTWMRNVESDYSQIALFGREGTLNYLVGSFGEFQTALLFEYVSQIARGVPALEPLISDTLQKGEQAKSDVNLMSSLGIQVKNYQPSASSFDVNIHPQAFTETKAFLSSGTDSTGFLDTLANYFFNASYRGRHEGDFQAMQDVLPEYLAEIANMDVEGIWSDKVTFYFISGTYFVPASAILQAQYNRENKKVAITGQRNGWTDKEILAGESDPAKDYWKSKKGGGFRATEANESAYSSYVNSIISLRGTLYYSSFKSSAYSLF